MGYLTTKISEYANYVRSDSLKPCLIDQVNIHNCLHYFKPDLIIEIGSGVSSVTFSNYTQETSCSYLSIDPSQTWALNTFRGLNSIGMQLPIFIDLNNLTLNTEVQVIVAIGLTLNSGSR